MLTHPSNRLWAEVVQIAFHLHWSLDSLLDLEHPARQRVLAEVRSLTAPDPRDPRLGLG